MTDYRVRKSIVFPPLDTIPICAYKHVRQSSRKKKKTQQQQLGEECCFSPQFLIWCVRSSDETWSRDGLSNQLCILVPADWQYQENVSVMNIKFLSSIFLPDGSHMLIVAMLLPADGFSYLYFWQSILIFVCDFHLTILRCGFKKRSA